jgi:hypothetical protein
VSFVVRGWSSGSEERTDNALVDTHTFSSHHLDFTLTISDTLSRLKAGAGRVRSTESLPGMQTSSLGSAED